MQRKMNTTDVFLGAGSDEVPLCAPVLTGNELGYITDCLKSGWVSSLGSYVDEFENRVARYVGARHAVATMNGTAALHVALKLAGVERDDEVLVSTLTFIAPANAIRYLGAWPVLIDPERQSWQMDPSLIGDFVEHECEWRGNDLINKSSGRRVKAVLPVHILGHPVDMDSIVELAQAYQLPVIEDATESLGATYKGRMVGKLGSMSCFSFNGNKIITSGSGGMIVTDSDEWATRAKYYTTQSKDDPIEYIHREVGYNYRLTNIQAAFGCAQIEKIDEFIQAKRRIANLYTEALTDIAGIDPLTEAPETYGTYWMYAVTVDESECGFSSRQLMSSLREQGIQTRPLWQPMHRSPAHSASQYIGEGIADEIVDKALCLPCSVNLSDEDLSRVIEHLRNR
jgi:aminotransferase in exopolysaccharide biosynthesis